MFKGIEFFKGKNRDKRYGLLRVARNDVCSAGRSMIEMLGVLAIIGVLSVGGIAGYSKAMEKFKLNKAVSEYSMLIFGVLEHLDDFKNLGTSRDVGVTDLAQSLNLIPDSWTVHNAIQSSDAYGFIYQR